MKKILLLAAFFIILSIPIYAATIHGTVYDLSLEPIDAFVEINSVPKQFVVAVNGEYSFDANPGKYILRANTSEGTAVELIEIVEEGDYVIDMIIGLDIEDPIDFIDETEVTDITDINGATTDSGIIFNPVIIGLILIGIITIFILVLFVQKGGNIKKSKITDTHADMQMDISDIEIRTIELIRKHSRITQKELRKMLPYSEAKVSLVIAQLESEGKIKKIKKGRGNILVYVKG